MNEFKIGDRVKHHHSQMVGVIVSNSIFDGCCRVKWDGDDDKSFHRTYSCGVLALYKGGIAYEDFLDKVDDRIPNYVSK